MKHLAIAGSALLASWLGMALILPTLENYVSWRRMMAIASTTGLFAGGGATIAYSVVREKQSLEPCLRSLMSDSRLTEGDRVKLLEAYGIVLSLQTGKSVPMQPVTKRDRL